MVVEDACAVVEDDSVSVHADGCSLCALRGGREDRDRAIKRRNIGVKLTLLKAQMHSDLMSEPCDSRTESTPSYGI